MGLFDDILRPVASHSETLGLNDPRLWDGIGRSLTAGGQNVTDESAMGVIAYYACLRVIAEDIGKLPNIVYKRDKDGSRERVFDAKIAERLSLTPNMDMTAQSLYTTVTGFAAGTGNGLAEIVRNPRGDDAEFFPIHPSRLKRVEKRSDGLHWIIAVTGEMDADVKDEDMLNIVGFSPDGIMGYHPSVVGANAIGTGLAQDEYSASFYGNGAHLGTIIKPSKALEKEARDGLKKTFNRENTGSGNFFGTYFLPFGFEIDTHQFGISPKEAAVIEGSGWTVEQVCRLHRVYPVKVGHNQNTPFANISSLNKAHWEDTLMSWAKRWRSELSRKVFIGPLKDMWAEFSPDALLAGLPAERMALYRGLFQAGAISPNEIRKLENMPSLGPDGDKTFVQVNMAPIDKPLHPVGQPPQAPKPTRASVDAHVEAQRPIITDASRRIVRKETKAVGRAMARHDSDIHAFLDWAEEFYSGHREYMSETFGPGVYALRATLSLIEAPHSQNSITDFIHTYCANAVTVAAEAFKHGTAVAESEDKNADLLADKIIKLTTMGAYDAL